jgi:hypothetical protein
VNEKVNEMFEGEDIMILNTLQSQSQTQGTHRRYNNIRETKKNLFERAKE